MNVEELISELKQMPPTFEVAVSLNDVSENDDSIWQWKIAGWAGHAVHFVRRGDSTAGDCVIIRCY